MIEEAYLRTALWWRSRPMRVAARLARKRPHLPPRLPQVDVIRTAAVQYSYFPARNPVEYVDRCYELVRRAAEDGAELVVFPENVGAPLFTLMPGLADMLQEHRSMDAAVAALAREGRGDEELQVADVLAVLTPAVRRVYFATFSALARQFRVHLMAGSVMLADADGRVYNRVHLFGPAGQLIGSQDKCHLLPMEREWGLSAGQTLPVFSTPVGEVGLPICTDATYFETFDILRAQGAEIALVGVANPEPYHPYKALRGLWPRVQESQMFGVQSALVGQAFGFPFSGPTAIYAPLALTPRRDGVLAQVESVDHDEVIVADLDLAALRQLRRERVQPKNISLIRKYLPELYTRPWPWVEGRAANEGGTVRRDSSSLG